MFEIRLVDDGFYERPHEVARVKICECQIEKRFRAMNAAQNMSKKERTHTFDSAVTDGDNREAMNKIKSFLKNLDENLEEGRWMYIYGDPAEARAQGMSAFGTGKSYLTHCIGNWLTINRRTAIYITEDQLLNEIKNTYNRGSNDTEEEVMNKYERVPILLIDDLFKSKITDWVEDKLFHLLNNRLKNGKMTIINSNYNIDRIEQIMPKNGGAIASRIIGQSEMICMMGKDRRKKIER